MADNYRPIKKALIAYSGSMESAKAIRHFLHLNPWPGVTLHIVHFKEGPEKEKFLLKDAAEFCEAHGFEVKTDEVEGQPRSGLLPFARENDADLIVMGSHGKTGLERLLVGSVSERVIGNSECPVMVVKL